MLSLPLKVRSKGIFRKQIQERIQRWQSVSAYTAILRVPYEHRWWYWQEFGTASGYDAPDAMPEGMVVSNDLPSSANPSGYGIVPKLHSGTDYLVFEAGGTTHFARSVHHPGIKARKPVRKVLETIVAESRQYVRSALAHGGSSSPEHLKAAVKATGERAKQLIVQSFGLHVSGVRKPNPEYPNQTGKLGGSTAADVLKDAIAVSVQKES
jgi:hypothetical protein